MMPVLVLLLLAIVFILDVTSEIQDRKAEENEDEFF